MVTRDFGSFVGAGPGFHPQTAFNGLTCTTGFSRFDHVCCSVQYGGCAFLKHVHFVAQSTRGRMKPNRPTTVRGCASQAQKGPSGSDQVANSRKSDDGHNKDAAVLSRRSVLAGLGWAGIFAVAGSTLLTAGPAEALVNAPVMEPQVAGADALVRVAERAAPEEKLADSDGSELAEFTGQRRRRYWRRRAPRRRYWRRRYRRVVCRRRWYRGRLVRVCRRVW
jgi:hypothetical protein